MRLRILLAKVNPEAITVPTRCVYTSCSGRKFHLRQEVTKSLRGSGLLGSAGASLSVLKCKRTFQVYPRSGQPRTDITASERAGCDVVSVGVKLWGDLLGARSPWGVPGKSRVYDAVQQAASRVPGLKRDQVFTGVRLPALRSDLTSVKCKGAWLPLGITVDSISGLALTIDAMTAEDTKTLKDWIEPIAKSVADEVGVQHQV